MVNYEVESVWMWEVMVNYEVESVWMWTGSYGKL